MSVTDSSYQWIIARAAPAFRFWSTCNTAHAPSSWQPPPQSQPSALPTQSHLIISKIFACCFMQRRSNSRGLGAEIACRRRHSARVRKPPFRHRQARARDAPGRRVREHRIRLTERRRPSTSGSKYPMLFMTYACVHQPWLLLRQRLCHRSLKD